MLVASCWLNRRTEEVLSSRGGFATDYSQLSEVCEIARALEEWYEEKVTQANQFPLLGELHDATWLREVCTAIPQERLNAIGNIYLTHTAFTECPLPNQLQ